VQIVSGGKATRVIYNIYALYTHFCQKQTINCM